MNRVRRAAGLTVVEVLLALVVIGIVTAAFTTAVVGNFRNTAVTGGRTEAVQILSYLGRRAAGGDEAVLPSAGGSKTWAYGSLSSAFPDLVNHGGLTDPADYRARIDNPGDATLAGASSAEYDVTVCYQAGGAEHCVSGTTMGLSPSSGSTTLQLPGIY